MTSPPTTPRLSITSMAARRTTTAFGGPSRTRNASGIVNSDWFVTQGGDGFRSQVDPEDPNTIYAELQNGNTGALRQDAPASAWAFSRKPAAAKIRCAGIGTRLSSSVRTRTRGSILPPTNSIAVTIAATPGK